MRWLPRVANIDVLFALAAFGALLADPLLLHKVTGLTPAMWALSFLAAVPLVARRRFPLAVLAAEVPLLFACLAVAHPNRAAVGIVMLLVFTVGLAAGRRSLWSSGALDRRFVTAPSSSPPSAPSRSRSSPTYRLCWRR